MERIAPQAPVDPAPPSMLMSQARARGFRRRLILIAGITMALILGMAVIVIVNATEYRQYNRATQLSHRIERQVLQASDALRHADQSLDRYLVTGDTASLTAYLSARAEIEAASIKLVLMTADHAAQQQRAKAFGALAQKRLQGMQQLLQHQRNDGNNPALALERLRLATDARPPVATLVQAMLQAENEYRAQSEIRRRRSATLVAYATVASLATALILVLLSVLLALREQRNTAASREELMQAYLQLAQSLEESRGMTDRIQRLHLLSETLQSCRNIREALAALPPILADMLPDSAGIIYLLNATHDLAEQSLDWGDPVLQSEPVFAPDECLALRRGQAYPDPAVGVNMRCAHLEPDANGARASWVCIPLLAQGETLGVMHLQMPGPMRPEIHELAVTLGEQLGLMLGNLKLQESLRIQSIHDPLTGLFNRRFLESALSRELMRNTRHERDLSLLMIDIDHFKQFNDRHGHDAGDELLQQFARLMRGLVRTEDIVCRYGGEEFTVILHETNLQTGIRRAEEIVERTRTLHVRHQDKPLDPVTVSIGLASQRLHGSDPKTLLQRADRALYQAKENGRNRVETAVPAKDSESRDDGA